MGYRDKLYGVTWKTNRSANPTTVWFRDKHKRNNFITSLVKNKIVLKDSIAIHSRNADDNEF